MKKALLVGINDYPGTANDLMGCVNDVNDVRDLLTASCGFKVEDVTLLTDRDATCANLVEALAALVREARAGDHLVFHFSGHGSQVPDSSGDEPDALDEILCPYDLDWQDKVIRDDDLNRIFAPVPPGALVEVLLDSCHSGTGLRDVVGSYRKPRFLPAPVEILPRGSSAHRVRPMKRPARCVLWTACRADQYAADAWIDNRYGGAFTTCFCRLARQIGTSVARRDLLGALRRELKGMHFNQVPQLEASRKLKRAELFPA